KHRLGDGDRPGARPGMSPRQIACGARVPVDDGVDDRLGLRAGSQLARRIRRGFLRLTHRALSSWAHPASLSTTAGPSTAERAGTSRSQPVLRCAASSRIAVSVRGSYLRGGAALGATLRGERIADLGEEHDVLGGSGLLLLRQAAALAVHLARGGDRENEAEVDDSCGD